MPNKQIKTSSQLHYKRQKDQVEIDGHPKDVKLMIWFELLTSRLMWLVITLILLFALPEAAFLPVLIKFIRNKFFF